MSFDENDRLDSHWLLYSHGKCAHNERFLAALDSGTIHTTHRQIASISGDLESLLLGNIVREFTTFSDDHSCSAVMLEIGVPRDMIQNAIPENTFHMEVENESDKSKGGWASVRGHTGVGSESMKQMTLRQWLVDSNKAEIGWMSYRPGTATIYWIDDNDKMIDSGTLRYGERETVWLQTRLGHRFEIIGNEDGEVWWTNWHVLEDQENPEGKRKVVDHTSKIGTPHSGIWVVGDSGSGVDVKRGVNQTNSIRNTLMHEWRRSRATTRSFTEVGFAKARLPPDLYASILTYYYNNRFNMAREEWDRKGVFVNWWQSDVYMIGMPWVLKKYWQTRLKQLVEQWIGGKIPLELTDIYGMRRYEDGASLLPHVDREQTHAASMIVNIAQGDVQKPWPLEIYDHGDRLHLITMEPGDIVFYESAKCLHSRVDPLQGGHYVNMFVHFRPVGDDGWYKKPNPPGTPEPLLDIGKCTSENGHVSCTKEHPASLAPSLETVTSGMDMFERWRRLMLNHPKTIPAVFSGPVDEAPEPPTLKSRVMKFFGSEL